MLKIIFSNEIKNRVMRMMIEYSMLILNCFVIFLILKEEIIQV